MAYDPTVPVESNIVRGVSGDLQKMQENFSLLSGAAVKGISGLIGVDANTPTSGNALRFNGANWVPSGAADDLDSLTDVTITGPASGEVLAFDGADWVNSGLEIALTLSGLTDVDDTLAPTSGQSLVFDGTEWVASGLVVAPRSTLGLSGSAYTVTGTSFDERVPIGSVLTSGGGFTFNTTSGQIVVGSGITAINILAQAGWVGPLEAAAMYIIKIFKNGSGLQADAGYKVAAEQAMRGTASGGVWVSQANAINVPCTSGDLFTLVVHTDDPAGTRTLSGLRTFLMIEDARKGAGGGSSVADPVTMCLPWVPPLAANAHIMNDEFISGNGGGPGGLDSRWQEWDPNTLVVPSLVTGSQLAQLAMTAGNNWGGIVQTISGLGTPSGTDWAAYARVHVTFDRQTATASATFGLAVFRNAVLSGATSNFAGVFVRMTGSGTTEVFEVGEYADHTDLPAGNVSSAVASTSGEMHYSGCWLRLRHQGGTNRIDGDVSADGIGWRQFTTYVLPWAPVEIGVPAIDIVEAGTGTRIRVSLFRVVSGLSGRHNLIPAGKIRLDRVGDNTADTGT